MLEGGYHFLVLPQWAEANRTRFILRPIDSERLRTYIALEVC